MTALPSLAVIPEGNRLAGKPVPYEMDQFVPLARMFADPPILAVKNSSPWNSAARGVLRLHLGRDLH